MASSLPPSLVPLAPLVGRWKGKGMILPGDTEYHEELMFDHTSFPQKPILSVTQRTFRVADGQPLHAESGFIRAPPTNRQGEALTQPIAFDKLQPPPVRPFVDSPWNLAKNYTYLYRGPELDDNDMSTENQIDTHYIRTETNPEHQYAEWIMAYPFGMTSVEAGWATPLQSEGGADSAVLLDTWVYSSLTSAAEAEAASMTGKGSDGQTIVKPFTALGHSATTKPPATTGFRRILRVTGGNTLHYEFYMQNAKDKGLYLHLYAELTKVE
ncbi:hypothetical protein H4R35_003303 [Dimargaris xerosporica]|nr:hypothetical protein H4R35_003303 [Dimargaris xerosporica]